jgi:transposase-like protein
MPDDICGAECTDGSPCENPADSCPWHCADDPPETGRPTKLSYERQEQIAQTLESGVAFKAACEAAGISEATGHRWLRLGEDEEEGEFSEFRQRITRARGVGKYDLSQSIVEIAKETNDARTLLKYLQHVEGGEASNEEELAGLNLVVPEVAQRESDE